MSDYAQDLVVLVADKNMALALEGLLSRSSALHIRAIRYRIFTHIGRDPGCLNEGHEFLRPLNDRFRHALVVFDHEGCGQETVPLLELEKRVDENLSGSGWGDRAKAIIISPELEIWIWNDSPHVARTLGWDPEELRNWLAENGFTNGGQIKPNSPKRAMEEALRLRNKRRSSVYFKEIASKVSLENCRDESFVSLKNILVQWFGAQRNFDCQDLD